MFGGAMGGSALDQSRSLQQEKKRSTMSHKFGIRNYKKNT